MARNEHKKVLQQLSEAYDKVYKEGALGSALAGFLPMASSMNLCG
tara:strand:- start:655 stop:789 length:135 start_codon:yes stop_codon:yes gene_type:complete